MLLVDKDIKKVAPKVVIPYDETKVSNICYDIEIEKFCRAPGEEYTEIDLMPGDSIYIQSKESIQLPDDLAINVVLRNTRIRQGLTLDAPTYQPGHYTKVFFRISNVSDKLIHLESRESVASLQFIRLSGPAEHPYDGTYQDEIDYRGMGKIL